MFTPFQPLKTEKSGCLGCWYRRMPPYCFLCCLKVFLVVARQLFNRSVCYLVGEFSIDLLQQCLTNNICILYYKINRKTCLVHLWCDNALGKCWENTQKACKILGYASCFTCVSPILLTFPACIIAP